MYAKDISSSYPYPAADSFPLQREINPTRLSAVRYNPIPSPCVTPADTTGSNLLTFQRNDVSVMFHFPSLIVSVHDAAVLICPFFLKILVYLLFIFISSFSCLLHFPLYFCPKSSEKFAKEWVSVSYFYFLFSKFLLLMCYCHRKKSPNCRAVQRLYQSDTETNI